MNLDLNAIPSAEIRLKTISRAFLGVDIARAAAMAELDNPKPDIEKVKRMLLTISYCYGEASGQLNHFVAGGHDTEDRWLEARQTYNL
jgi:hypothetical protein